MGLRVETEPRERVVGNLRGSCPRLPAQKLEVAPNRGADSMCRVKFLVRVLADNLDGCACLGIAFPHRSEGDTVESQFPTLWVVQAGDRAQHCGFPAP